MIIKCPECELQVSDKALSCPHCGYPIQSPKSKKPTREKSHMRLPNGFGQISKVKGNLRNPYRAMVTVGKTETGKPISKVLKPQGYFSTYNEAYAALIEYNKNPYDLDEAITVLELYEKWTGKYFENIKPSSKRTITAAWAYCTPVYYMRAKDIRVGHIKTCMDNCDSPNTKNRIKSMFNLMLDYALEYGLVDKNYARDFKTESVEAQSTHKAFSDSELGGLWKNQNTPYVCYILLQCYMGWRPQELCKLKKSDVDLEKNIIVGGMKTEAGTNRAVPICSKIMPVLKKVMTLSDALGSEYLCPSLDGSEMTYNKYNKRFRKIMSELSFTNGHRPHDPRKQFVSMCKAVEVDEYAVKRFVGHAIDDITERLYTDRKEEWFCTEIEKLTNYSFEQ